MRQAQWISSMIYIAYIGLLAFCFPRGGLTLEETAIISLMEIVAPILPLILIAGALAAQFSAATADMAGSGGLVSELTGGRISSRVSYAVLAATGIVLTWQANVFEIISYASRAFALYYALQAAIASVSAWRRGAGMTAIGLGLLSLFGLAIFIFASPARA